MMRRPTLWTLISLAACAALVSFQLQGLAIAAAIAKLTASTAFIVVAVSAGAPESGWGRALLAGLGLSWFGDAFLLGTTDTWFLLGLSAFLLAHLAYLTAFLLRGVDLGWVAGAALAVLLFSSGVAIWLMPHVGGGMRIPVLAYLVVINLMVIGAMGARGAGATWLLPAGAMAFYFSDLGVAARQFLQPEFPPYVWSLPLYYAGQLMLAWGPAGRGPISPPRSPPR
ncbi:lysoplasmalogenase [Lentisalinibacter sediminis]|uniref:lysoplasmalogenase n=1 Tax=Lentisalinibacter sediminis TaxID=2992237 RepID=UPI0038647C15